MMQARDELTLNTGCVEHSLSLPRSHQVGIDQRSGMSEGAYRGIGKTAGLWVQSRNRSIRYSFNLVRKRKTGLRTGRRWRKGRGAAYVAQCRLIEPWIAGGT